MAGRQVGVPGSSAGLIWEVNGAVVAGPRGRGGGGVRGPVVVGKGRCRHTKGGGGRFGGGAGPAAAESPAAVKGCHRYI